jgi:hypothetical protein
MAAHDQLLAAVQRSSNSEVPLAEAEVAQVPDRILLADDAIPATHKLGVVFLDRGKWAKGLCAGEGDNASVAEVTICDEEDFAHNSITLKILIIIPLRPPAGIENDIYQIPSDLVVKPCVFHNTLDIATRGRVPAQCG